MTQSARPVIVAYIPVLHQGYLNFLTRHTPAEKVYVLSSEIRTEFPHLHKDVRALPAEQVLEALKAWNPDLSPEVIAPDQLPDLAKKHILRLPDEDIMREMVARYRIAESRVVYETVFLRWDKSNSLKAQPVTVNETLSLDELQHRFLQRAQQLATKSADWWRQVGAVAVQDNQVILGAYNHHLPDEQQPYYDGDPRGNFHKGQYIYHSTAIHAEADIVSQAAKAGISLAGAALYVTTFPCPYCAKLLAHSGIEELYFSEGYGLVDGEKVLRSEGVKLIKVTI